MEFLRGFDFPFVVLNMGVEQVSKRDYYEVLGLGKDASQDEIKKAYRKMARQYHPDVNKAADAEDKFKEAKEAYDVLSDDQKRAQYDQFGHVDPNQGMGGGRRRISAAASAISLICSLVAEAVATTESECTAAR